MIIILLINYLCTYYTIFYIVVEQDRVTCLQLNGGNSKRLSSSSRGRETKMDLLVSINRFAGPGCLLLVGPSGSGKTTTLDLLAGVRTPVAGDLCIESTNKSVPLAYEQQVPCIISGLTLAENLLGTTYTHDKLEYCKKLLVSLSLSDFVNDLEVYVAHPLTFSGGEQKRLSLIRAICSEAPLILLDEITQGLDDACVSDVKDVLGKTKQDKLIVIATHDRRLYDLADTCLSVS